MNWSREKARSSERASDFASMVFPTPGKSSMITWPSASRQRTQSRACRAARGRRARGSRRRARATSAADAATARIRATRLPSCAPRAAAPPRRGSPRRSRSFGAFATLALARRAMTSTTSLSGASKPMSGRADVVVDDEVDVLVVEHLLACALETGLARLGPEADEHLPVALRCSPSAREDVGRRLELDRPRLAVLRRACRRRLGRPVVGDGGGHQDDVGVRARPSASRSRSAAVGVSTTSTPAGAGTARFAASSVTSAPRARRLRGERDAHAARRAVAEEADGVERLARAACADEHASPPSSVRVAPPEELLDARAISSGSAIRPTPDLALGELALLRPDELDSARRAASRRWPASPGAPTCAVFIAGATSTGPRCASAASVRTSSASPCASRASVFAVSGATTSRSARSRCG